MNEFGYVGEVKVCDGCGELYWLDPGGEYRGPHYTLIREGRDEESGSAGSEADSQAAEEA